MAVDGCASTAHAFRAACEGIRNLAQASVKVGIKQKIGWTFKLYPLVELASFWGVFENFEVDFGGSPFLTPIRHKL